VTLAVTKNTSLGRIVWRQRMPVSREHRSFLTGNQWDIVLLSGRGKTPTLCAFPVFSVAVTAMFCDTCGDGANYLLWNCLAS
jgi:hypothetical protein